MLTSFKPALTPPSASISATLYAPQTTDAPETSSDLNNAIEEVRCEITSRAETLGGGLAHFVRRIVNWITGSKEQEGKEKEEEEQALPFLQAMTLDVKFITKLNSFLHEPTAKSRRQILSFANTNQNDFDLDMMRENILSLLRNNYKENTNIKCAVDQLVALFFPMMHETSRMLLVFTAIETENNDLFVLLKELNQKHHLPYVSSVQAFQDLFLKQDFSEAKAIFKNYPLFSHISKDQLTCVNGTVLESDSFRIHVKNCYQRYLETTSQNVEVPEENEDPEQEWRACLKAIRG